MKRTLRAGIVLLALCCGLSYAGEVDPDLAQLLSNVDRADEMFDVQFLMKEQATALQLDPTLGSLPKAEKRARVGRVLMDFADQTQAELMRYLRTQEAAGKVDGIHSIWIVNEVACRATRDVIYAIAARADVDYAMYGIVATELTKPDLDAPPSVTSVEPNLVTTNARGAWKQGYTGQNVVVGVVDTGVRYTHDDLDRHLWTSTVYPNPGFNYASVQLYPGAVNPSSYDTLTPLDYYGHGTHCAGIVSADGTYGNNVHDTMGVAPSAKLMCLPVLVYFNGDSERLMEQSIFLAYQFVVRPPRDTLNGGDIITMSLGTFYSRYPRRWSYRIAETNLMHAGITHFVASGNEGSGYPKIRCPGDCPPPWPHPSNNPTSHDSSAVITVGATDNNDLIASFSSRGPMGWEGIQGYNDYVYPPGGLDPDVCMPGVNIYSTSYAGDRTYTTMSGTSMATPGAAGVGALMMSKNPNIGPRQIDSILELYCVRDLGTSGKDNTFGAGRLNCSLAVAFTPPPISHDVGVTRIAAPIGTMDSTTITPACTVYNYGSSAETYSVRMKIGGAYDVTATVTGHAPYTSRAVTFTPVDLPRGTYSVSCSTEAAVDERRVNDKQTGSVTIQLHDVGTTVLLNPVGVFDSGTVVTPACTVFNYGSLTENYTVRMKVSTTYDNTVAVTSHAPLTAVYLTFPDWTALERGVLAVSCSTEMASDNVPANDKQTGTAEMRAPDIGVDAISGIPVTVDSGAVLNPTVTFHNYGNVSSFFDIFFTIDDGYSETFSMTLAAGAESIHALPAWTAALRGMRTIRCSTYLSDDLVPGNDVRGGACNIRVHDQQAVAIIAPNGAISPGPVNPQATIRNNGTAREPVMVTFMINSTPPYSRAVTFGGGLPLGTDTTVRFPSWTATAGAFTAKCSVYSVLDQVLANDVATAQFACGNIDVSVTAIVTPNGYVTPGAVTPQVKVLNTGDATVNIPVSFEIFKGGTSVYTDNQTATGVAPNAEATVSFTAWTADTGNYTTKAKSLFPDANPANDSLLGSFICGTLQPGWWAKAVVPAGPKGKNVKDGGALVYAEGMDDGKVYAFKGNNRYEFYAYNVADNVWATLESIPAIGRAGKKKAVKKGASLAFANGKVLGAKGNNSVEFWEYTPGTDAGWAQKPDVPLGARAVKEGSGQATVVIGGSPYVYLLKGSATTEFYRYDVTTEAWETKAVAPLGASGKAYKNGSTIAYDGMGTIYAVKGSYNEFFSYSVDSDRWSQLASVPLIGTSGKKKKLKDGAGLGCIGDNVYALKGGNTQEFYVYSKTTNAWTQKEDIPLGGGKRVKGGGAVTSTGAVLYVLKGNNTAEFYQYVPGAFAAQASSFKPQALAQAQAPSANYALRVTPNPFTGRTTLSYSLPSAGNVDVRIYDVTGNLVRDVVRGYQATGHYDLNLDASGLARGIYVLRFDLDGATTTSKLIIE